MAMPFLQAGLLGPGQSLAPGIGGDNDPVKAMLARLAMGQQAQVRNTTGTPYQDPALPAPGPFAPPGGASDGPPGGAQGAPPPPPPPRPAPPKTPKPLRSPTQLALFHAGEAVSEAPNMASAVARGLSMGVRTFHETKESRATQQHQREALDAALADPNVPPGLANLIRAAEAVETGRGLKLYSSIMEKDMEPQKLAPGEELHRTLGGGGRGTVTRGADRTTTVGNQLFNIGRGEDGSNVATALTDQPLPEATGTMREFVGQYKDEILDPHSYNEWSNPAKDALAAFVKERDEGKGVRVSVNTQLAPGAEHFQERMFSDSVTRFTDDYDRVRKGQVAEASLARVMELLEEPTFAGPAADQLSSAVLFARRFTGLDVGASKAEATQAIEAHLKNVIIPRLAEMGTRPSDKDLEVLSKSIGTTEYTPAVLREIVQLQRNYMRRYENEFNADWVAMYEQSKAMGLQLPANIRPVGASSDLVRAWAESTPEQRKHHLDNGGEDPTAFVPFMVTRFVGNQKDK